MASAKSVGDVGAKEQRSVEFGAAFSKTYFIRLFVSEPGKAGLGLFGVCRYISNHNKKKGKPKSSVDIFLSRER